MFCSWPFLATIFLCGSMCSMGPAVLHLHLWGYHFILGTPDTFQKRLIGGLINLEEPPKFWTVWAIHPQTPYQPHSSLIQASRKSMICPCTLSVTSASNSRIWWAHSGKCFMSAHFPLSGPMNGHCACTDITAPSRAHSALALVLLLNMLYYSSYNICLWRYRPF